MMKTIKIRHFLKLFVFGLVISSCKKDTTDFSKFDNYSPEPEFAIPIANTSISMLNLIQNDSVNTRVDGNGLVHFTYRQDDIFKYDIADFFAFENNNSNAINNSLGELSIGSFSQGKVLTLGELSNSFSPAAKIAFDALAGTTAVFPAISEDIDTMNSFNAFTEFSSVKFSDGYLILKITNKLPVNLSLLTLNLYNLTPTQSLVGVFNFTNITPGSSKSDSILLAGKTLRSSLGYTMPVFNTNSSAPTAVLVNYLDSISITATGRNLKAISGEAKFPSQDIITQNTEINFTPEDTTQRIRKLNLSTGKIKFVTQSTINEPIQITFSFPGAFKNGMPFSNQVVTIPFTGTNFYIDSSINISGVDFDLTQNINRPYNFIPVTYSARIISSGLPIIFDSSNSVNIQVYTSNTNVEYLEGYIGVIEIKTEETDFINLDFLKDIEQGLNLEDAELKVNVKNSIGVPIRLNYNFVGKNNSGKVQDAQMLPFDAAYPLINEQGVSKITDYTYSNKNNNGKINELMSLPPHYIKIEGKVLSNPIPNPNSNQFIKKGTGISVGLDMDLPLVLRSNTFALSDSNDFNVNDLKDFKAVTLGVNIENSFPFDAGMKIYFIGKNNKVIDSIDVQNIIKSSITDANGKTIQTSKSRSQFVLSEERLNKLILNEVTKVKYFTSLATENGGTKTVRIYSDYNMKIALGVIATIKKPK